MSDAPICIYIQRAASADRTVDAIYLLETPFPSPNHSSCRIYFTIMIKRCVILYFSHVSHDLSNIMYMYNISNTIPDLCAKRVQTLYMF